MIDATAAAAPPPTGPLRILLIEDDPRDAHEIVEMLKDLPAGVFAVEHADRLQPALDRIGHDNVDVILLGLGQPDSDGMETPPRTSQAGAREPIVVISGLGNEPSPNGTTRAGAQDYLVKGRIEKQLVARVMRAAIERKRAEVALEASETHYRTILDNVADAVFVTDAAGRFIDVNPQACQLTGHSRVELLELTMADTCLPEERLLGADRVAAATKGIRLVFTRHMLRRDGTTVLVEGNASQLPNGQVLSTFRDVTERSRAEATIRESEQRFRELAENVREVFFIMDPVTGQVQYVNPAYEEVFGHTREHAYSAIDAWTESIHPDDREQAAAAERDATHTGVFAASVFRVLRPDGSIRWVRSRATPVRDAAGLITRRVGVAEDITDLKRTEAQVLQAQKMEVVGRLAGGIAHDFNNLLTVIVSYGELLIADLGPSDPRREELNEIVSAGNRATELTQQLLAFSRQQVLEPHVLDINALVTNLSKMLDRLIGENIECATALAADIGSVRADPGEIEQVIMNLMINARDAMPNGGKVTIETTNVEMARFDAGTQDPIAPGPYVLLSITDTGDGMSDETRTHVFEPFFTTKPRGKGTGLGLATSYGIVKQSGGSIAVFSTLGRGTTFNIYLPRVHELVDAEPPRRSYSEDTGGGETIFLVEDETAVRKVTRKVLERRGYTVIESDRADVALALAATLPHAPDLVVTDVILPGVNGREMAGELEKLWSGVRVLYLSGYTDEAIARHGVLEPGIEFLQKPFTPDGLALKVRSVLDATPAVLPTTTQAAPLQAVPA